MNIKVLPAGSYLFLSEFKEIIKNLKKFIVVEKLNYLTIDIK